MTTKAPSLLSLLRSSGQQRRFRLMESANCSVPLADDSFYCTLDDGSAALVRNVYPPIQDLQPRVLVVVLIFVACFVIGVCGNTSVLTIIKSVVADRRGRTQKSGDNAILYVGALCLCDLLISLSLPPAILDSIIGFWIFGTPICKIHHLLGSVGRLASTFLITAMSFDRYVAICLPHISQLRERKFVVTLISSLTLVALILLTPLLIFAHAQEVILHELKAVDSNNITRVRVFKCTDSLPTELFYIFTITTFLCGYIIPLGLICFFNFQLARKVWKHKQTASKSIVPARRIVIYTLLIASVYFICWTPFWCSVLWAIVMSILDMKAEAEEVMLFAIFAVHLLPYFGSASNWIFYGLLNTQLQQRQESVVTATHDNNTTVRIRCEARLTSGATPTTSRIMMDGPTNCDEFSPSIRFVQETEQTML